MNQFLKKRSVLAIVSLFIGSLVATSVAQAAGKIRLSSRSTNWDMVLIESGAAKKYGIEIELVRVKTGVEVSEALIGGSVDVGSNGDTPVTSLLTRTNDVIVIGTAVSTDGGYAKVIVKKDSAIKTLADLKGKKIATKIGSGSYRALSDYCTWKGTCSLKDFKILNTAPSAILAALEAGSVDAGIWFPPTTSIAIFKGFGRVMMDFKGANIGQAMWLANKNFAEKNSDLVVRFLAATIEAQNILLKNHKRAAELLAKGFKKRGRNLPADVLMIDIDSFDYTPGVGDQNLKVLNSVFASMSKAGKLKGKKPDFNAMVNRSFMAKAMKLYQSKN